MERHVKLEAPDQNKLEKDCEKIWRERDDTL